ncbi:MAG: DUF1549 domain-containing protein [Gemmataceae bacterium]|nr:DUF1549 domain-containing protein [Gemmataceae bacterium]
MALELNRVRCGVSLLTVCIFVGAVQGQPLQEKIDSAIASKVPNYSTRASADSTDLEFLRRVTLDLHGTIPTAQEAREFQADKSPNKRAAQVDKLLADVWHPAYYAGVLDLTWMERRPTKHVTNDEWKQFLLQSMLENKPYDQLVREILTADGNDPKTRAASRFYLDRDAEPHLLTRDISRLFLGSNWQCAQCHDHPRVEDYKQDLYYGLFAFFNRTSVFTDAKTKKAVLAEKADGEASFQSVFDPKKTTKTSLPKMGARKELGEPKLEKGKEYDVAPAKEVRGVPKYSRRAKLAGELANGDFTPFPRNAANRLFNHMMGRGIVHPLDLDHSDNPPSHPELLDLLTKELVKMKFNQKEILGTLAKSKTYSRSSQAPKGSGEFKAEEFLVAAVRPMSAEQFAYALMQATGLTDAEKQAQGNKGESRALRSSLRAKIAPMAQPAMQAFASQPGEAATYDSRVEQALFLANNGYLQGLLSPQPGSLTFRLAALAPEQVADELYLSVLTRFPTEEEKKEVSQFLKARISDRAGAVRDLVWAMVTSVEFRFIS